MIAASVYLRPEHLISVDCVARVLRFGDVEIHFNADVDTAAAQVADLRRVVRGLDEHLDALQRDAGIAADKLAARLQNFDLAEVNAQPFGTPVPTSVVHIPVQGGRFACCPHCGLVCGVEHTEPCRECAAEESPFDAGSAAS